jgi:hypothetical protein
MCHANLRITLHPNAPASLTVQAKHPLPFLLIKAFHPLSAHNARAKISISLPNLCLCGCGVCGEGEGRIGKAVMVESVQSMTSTLGMVLLVVCIVERFASRGDWGGESRESKGRVDGRERLVERGTLVYVKPLWRWWPVCFVSNIHR